MILWPRKEQWETWSLPSKLTAIGTLIGIISLSLYGIEKLFHIKDSEKPSIKNSIANTNNSINIQNQGQIQIIQPSTQSNRAEQAPTTTPVPFSTKHVPEKQRMQTLAYDINKFLNDRKKTREELAKNSLLSLNNFDAETRRQFEEFFWTPVVLLRDKVGREYAEGDARLNFSPRNLEDVASLADGLLSVAFRLP